MAKKNYSLTEQAIDYLATLYDKGYVKKRMATKSYPKEWDKIIKAYRAGACGQVSD